MIPNAEGKNGPTTFFRITLIIICVMALCVSAILGIGIFMEGMSCGAPGSGRFCPDAVMFALMAWGGVSFLGPLYCLTWGLEPKRTSRERVVALFLMITFPVIGLVINFLMLIVGISLANLF